MRKTVSASVVVLLLVRVGARAAAASGRVESMFTSIKTGSCAQAVDENDPNDLTYDVCPGVPGYRLQIRLVESGRMSINVVDPAKRVFALDYQDVVTHSMDELDDRVEWRVRRENGKALPIALVVLVKVHGSSRDPEKITGAYRAVAKIGAGGACVTDRVREGSVSAAQVRALADSASGRPCAAPLP